jgi:hypothetical protein
VFVITDNNALVQQFALRTQFGASVAFGAVPSLSPQ